MKQTHATFPTEFGCSFPTNNALKLGIGLRISHPQVRALADGSCIGQFGPSLTITELNYKKSGTL